MATIQVDIVSAEGEIHSGEAAMVFAPAKMGEIGIAPGDSDGPEDIIAPFTFNLPGGERYVGRDHPGFAHSTAANLRISDPAQRLKRMDAAFELSFVTSCPTRLWSGGGSGC